MKKVLVYACFLLALHGNAQVIFTYGKHKVMATEFLQAFNKNPAATNRRQALQEYLPLYINYRLKVQDALDKRMDTLPSQQQELLNYRVQLEESYLAQLSQTDKLVQEAFTRSQQDLLAAHIFIRFNPEDSASMMAASVKANEAYKALQAGRPFTQVLQQYGNDEENRVANGRIGWITAFTLPYAFETALYDLKAGSSAVPIRGAEGYHIMHLLDTRPAVGKVQVAQILLHVPAGADASVVQKQQRLADSIHQLLKKGARFDSLALLFSEDRSSYGSGGLMPEFGVGTFDEAFEKEAFALSASDNLSRPFRTAFGFHILQFARSRPVVTDVDDLEYQANLRQQVMNSNRAVLARELFLTQKVAALNYRKHPYNEADLWTFSDSARRNGNFVTPTVKPSTLLFTMKGDTVNAAQWLAFLRASRGAAVMPPHAYRSMFQTFLLQHAEAVYKENLHLLEPAFALQLQEFKDANLLFENMDKQVWSAAALDSNGQAEYFKQYGSKYKWGAGARAILVTASDSLAALQYRNQLLQAPASWREYSERMQQAIAADSGRFELAQIPGMGAATAAPGGLTPLVSNSADNTWSFAYVIEPLGGGDQRSLAEARGWVITDYQEQIEATWLKRLQERYPVKMNDAVWQQVLNGRIK